MTHCYLVWLILRKKVIPLGPAWSSILKLHSHLSISTKRCQKDVPWCLSFFSGKGNFCLQQGVFSHPVLCDNEQLLVEVQSVNLDIQLHSWQRKLLLSAERNEKKCMGKNSPKRTILSAFCESMSQFASNLPWLNWIYQLFFSCGRFYFLIYVSVRKRKSYFLVLLHVTN